jgi:DNA-binding winged helix-turn-helix (wHTH) protein
MTEFGPFRFELQQRRLFRGDTQVRLGSRAREVLGALIEQAGQVVRKRDLMAHVWPDMVVEEGTLRVHISTLRKVLGEDGSGDQYIENVTGRGYRFSAPVTVPDS